MKKIFSGIQPSGVIHLGNYLGTIKQWVNMQNEYECIFSVVDLHAMTVFQEPTKFRKQILDTAKILLALGIDPKKSTLFVQSDLPEHLELFWILNTITKVSELELMTQYKDKTSQNKSTAAGLLNYPVLMASDVLLYDTDEVPVGEDQIQHLELTRELARRFNSVYGNTFKEPKSVIGKIGARIMGLDDPTKKMSKSASSVYNFIALTDTPDVVEEKIKRAVTDSGSEIEYDPIKKPGVSNLLTILSLMTNTEIKTLEKSFKGKNYGALKTDTSQAIINFLSEFQKKLDKLSDDKVLNILEKGAISAKKIASKKIDEVYKKVGLK